MSNYPSIYKEVADHLAGTCNYIDNVLDDFGLDQDEHRDKFSQYLEDIEQFECIACGWWSYPGELNVGGMCDECASGGDDYNEEVEGY